MIKKFTLMLVMLLGVVLSINAKSTVTTLWEGDASDEVIISADTFSSAKADDVIRIYFNCTEDNSLQVVYKIGENAYAFNGIGQWPWCNTSMSKIDLSINASDLTTLQAYGICIYGKAEKLGITKVTLISEITPNSETELLNTDWEGSETPKIFSAINSVKMGDVLQFTVSIAVAYTWIQFKLTDKDGNVDQFTGSGSEYQGNGDGSTTFTFEFTISTLNDLWTIMNSGFGIKKTYADNAFTITAVKLLSYDDSYDYTIDIEMGSDGYMTYSNSVNLDFSGTGLTPYYASEATKGTVTLTSATTTWNWQGYILRGPAGTHSPKVVADANASYPSGNLLRCQVASGTVYRSAYSDYSDGNDTNNESTTSEEYKIKTYFRYIFAKDSEDNIGFYKLTSDHTLGANKAYLETETDITPTTPGAPAIHLVFEEENGATALEQFEANDEVLKFIENGQLFIRKNGVTYDVMGRIIK